MRAALLLLLRAEDKSRGVARAEPHLALARRHTSWSCLEMPGGKLIRWSVCSRFSACTIAAQIAKTIESTKVMLTGTTPGSELSNVVGVHEARGRVASGRRTRGEVERDELRERSGMWNQMASVGRP